MKSSAKKVELRHMVASLTEDNLIYTKNGDCLIPDLIKADHRSKQYRLNLQLLKYFPSEIKTNKGLSRVLRQVWRSWPPIFTQRMAFPGRISPTDKENAGADR